MTLDDLRAYHRLREYQISHLLNAQEYFRLAKRSMREDQMLWLYLLYWADAMHTADEMQSKCGFVHAMLRTARGAA